MTIHGTLDACEDLSRLDLFSEFREGTPWGDAAPNWEISMTNGERDAFREMIRKASFKNLGKVLDVGAGWGRISVLLAEVNDFVAGIDQNEGGMEIARRLANRFELDNTQFQVASAQELPYPDNHFDGVWCYSVLNYTPRGAVLEEFRRVVRPGGRIFIGKYNSLGMLMGKFLRGLASQGPEGNLVKWAKRALANGTDSNGGANWSMPDSLEPMLRAHGLQLDENYGIEVTEQNFFQVPDSVPVDQSGLSETEKSLFGDSQELLLALENDQDFVNKLHSEAGRILAALPGDLSFVCCPA